MFLLRFSRIDDTLDAFSMNASRERETFSPAFYPARLPVGILTTESKQPTWQATAAATDSKDIYRTSEAKCD